MKCSYCGAEYDKSQLKCPFCGAENTPVIREHQEKTIFSLDQERRRINQMPEELLSQTSRKTLSLGRVILLIVVLLFFLTIAGSFFWKFYSDYRMEKNLARLEDMMQEKDYDGIIKLLDEADCYDYAYDPYWEIYWTYNPYHYLEEDLEWFYSLQEEEAEKSLLIGSLTFVLSDCIRPMVEAKPYLEDNLILGNETALEDISQKSHEALTQILMLTEQEIQELLDLNLESYDYDEDVLLPYARLALERME